jgi:hypothetical protein
MAADHQRRGRARTQRTIAIVAFVVILPTTFATSALPFWQQLLVTAAVAVMAIPIAVAGLGWWHERRTAS